MSTYPTQSEHCNPRTVATAPPYRPTSLPTPATQLSTAWMPLEGLIEHWGTFGAGATTSSELQAAGMALCALARESEALASYTAAQPFSEKAHYPDNLEYTLNGLLQARYHWTETLQALDPLLFDDRAKSEIAHEAIRTLIIEVMEQRLRLSALLHEVEQEQLVASRRLSTIYSTPQEVQL